MAILCNIFYNYSKTFTKNSKIYYHWIRSFTVNPTKRNVRLVLSCAAGGSIALYTAYKLKPIQSVLAASPASHVTKRVSDKRFIQFASVEYQEQLYMTPKDFLDAIFETQARPRWSRKILTTMDLKKIEEQTPPVSQNDRNFFRNRFDEGIISYTEYLFLLSILDKPDSSFTITFNMLDTDCNEKVDKKEFLIMTKIFSTARELKNLQKVSPNVARGDMDELQGKNVVNTTLILHFFGPQGSSYLDLKSFKQFILHLQDEILELEFNQFAKGFPLISEMNFARILLRYTHLTDEESGKYLSRLTNSNAGSKYITFEDYRNFCRFLYHLEDFNLATKLYIKAGVAINEEHFNRLVRTYTGASLSQHLVHTVFTIFDINEDGLLSYKEFFGIMQNRLHRRYKRVTNQRGLKAFMRCIRHHMT